MAVYNEEATDGGSNQNDENRFSQFVSETILPYDLQVVLVGIGSATYDQIEYDLAFTMEGALGLVGGTMGLFSGFSVLSGVEIVYYLAKYICKSFSYKRKA